MNLADQVKIAKDVTVFPLRGDCTEGKELASVRGHITPNNPYQNRVKNKIESYKDIYDGDINAAKSGWQYRWRYDPHM
jgi:hypothetical protein